MGNIIFQFYVLLSPSIFRVHTGGRRLQRIGLFQFYLYFRFRLTVAEFITLLHHWTLLGRRPGKNREILSHWSPWCVSLAPKPAWIFLTSAKIICISPQLKRILILNFGPRGRGWHKIHWIVVLCRMSLQHCWWWYNVCFYKLAADAAW